MRTHRVATLLAFVALVGGAAAFSACSSTSSQGFAEDAGVDATAPFDAPADTAPDRGADAAPPFDAALAVEGGCSAINTACDIVVQNCPAGQECASAVDGGDAGTACIDVAATRHLPKGHACCASAPDDPCGPGLHCIGPRTDCSGDAGASGRCAPACCADDVCGTSDPEGFAGRCDLSIVDGKGNERFKVCDYDPPCRPFHLLSCPAKFTCVTQDQYGTSSCIGIYAPTDGGTIPTGYTEGMPCSTSNGCADGLACLGAGDAGATCQWLCLEPNANPPFDAGAARDGGPGYGGCPAAEKCQGTVTGLPLWLLFCTP
jgi:hypothetical protein